MSIQLGICLGPSFAEFCLLDKAAPGKILASERVYTPVESLGSAIARFLKQNEQRPERLVIASHFLEKILGSKLGGTVGQVVTAGFESWPWLRQSLQTNYFAVHPQRTEALASRDLIFGLEERIDSRGKIIKELAQEDLNNLVQTLKSKKVQRVCVNLLFSKLNPVHLIRVKDHLINEGFDVYFSLEDSSNEDEVQVWRRNILNAAFTGTFRELRDSISQSITESVSEDKLFFLGSRLQAFTTDPTQLTSSIFAPLQVLAQLHKDENLVLNLGLENWLILEPKTKAAAWNSAWGLVASTQATHHYLNLQPTSELQLDEFKDISFSQARGYEPGPMAFGRAQRPQVFDILQFEMNFTELSKWTSKAESRQSSFIQSMRALAKVSRRPANENTEKLISSLRDQIIDEIALSCLLRLENTATAKITVTGFFAEHLIGSLQKRWPKISWKLAPNPAFAVAAQAARLEIP